MPVINKDAELAYQAARARKIIISPTSEDIFDRYAENKHWDVFTQEFLFKSMGNLRGKRVLDFGCGEGEIATVLARFGAHLTAVDLSPDLIDVARARIAADGGTANVEFLVMDILESDLPRNSYDIVIGSAVLHHVELDRVVPKLFAFVKPGGRIYFLEPIAYSSVLQKIRNLVPVSNNKSPDERQLNRNDIDFVSRTCHADVTYFRFLDRLSRLAPKSLQLPIAKALGRIDRLLITAFPSLHKYFGSVVIAGKKPLGT